MLARILLSLVVVATLASCGTVTPLQLAPGVQLGTKKYDNVVVRDFTSSVLGDEGEAATGAKIFTGKVIANVQEESPHIPVSHNGQAGKGSLVISGVITEYVEGNAALRFFVGLGAGNARFGADINFYDGGSGQKLGTVQAARKSYPLGGAIGAHQGIDNLMDDGAAVTCEEAAKLLLVAH